MSHEDQVVMAWLFVAIYGMGIITGSSFKGFWRWGGLVAGTLYVALETLR